MHLLSISPGEGFHSERWLAVLRSGIDAFMVREKQMDARALLDAVRRAQDLAPEVHVWVNGRLDVALAAGCGLHAPEAYPDIPPLGLSLSQPLHAPTQFPERAHAHQLLISPVFPVPGKGPAWGEDGLLRFLAGLPAQGPRLLALGGLRPNHLAALRHPRLDGIALLRALWETPDPRRTVAHFRNAWANAH